MQNIDQIKSFLSKNQSNNILNSLMDNLKKGLIEYWITAEKILDNSGVKLKKPDFNYYSLEKNFFSLIFLYSYYRADISTDRIVLYATINQCLRGMVTGCDNILDDEYKKTIDTDLPEKGYKFRSVLDIMTSDRILFHILQKRALQGDISYESVDIAVDESLRCLLKSGAQEASEEEGVSEFLKPEIVLSGIHHYKTGILFQSPWAIPSVLEHSDTQSLTDIKKSLYDMGMGCQIMDDMVDLAMDINMKRHNYVASLIFHSDTIEKNILEEDITKGSFQSSDSSYLEKFPLAMKDAAKVSYEYLKRGTEVLFKDEHMFMRGFAINFVTKQIGAESFFKENN
ncbi:MAG: polyprenyl synthetase family protein [Desulfobacterales bacterium]|nr:polyprenyl synthetase family protein [Desulfobacterales bacterium]MCP4159812.1 polyprenyl synthetase family protein [Deltaproteobacteria bacterium]